MSDEHDVDHLLRTARADVARLALQMRAARRAVEGSEPGAAAGVDAPADLPSVAADLSVRPEAERPGLAEDLAQVRADALRLLSSARAEVAQRVATSSDEALQLLQGPAAAPGAPSLRVAVPPLTPADAPLPVAVVAPSTAVAPAPPVEQPAEAVTEALPVVAPEAVPAMVPAAVAAARAAVAPAAPPATPIVADPMGGVVVVVTVPQGGVPTSPVHGYAPSPVEPRRPASKVLYADVVLPILAVVVLLIILLAWVG